jgi:hypothetical protein
VSIKSSMVECRDLLPILRFDCTSVQSYAVQLNGSHPAAGDEALLIQLCRLRLHLVSSDYQHSRANAFQRHHVDLHRLHQALRELYSHNRTCPFPPFALLQANQHSDASQPSISQASLPQLTVDVLIHSLDFKRQGKLHDAGMVVPMVGEDESEDGGIVSGGLEGPFHSLALFLQVG